MFILFATCLVHAYVFTSCAGRTRIPMVPSRKHPAAAQTFLAGIEFGATVEGSGHLFVYLGDGLKMAAGSQQPAMQGGLWSPQKVTYSKETQNLLKGEQEKMVFRKC